MNSKIVIVVAMAAGIISQSNPVWAELDSDCAKVEPYLNKSEYRLAEGAARMCLEKFPNHVRVWYLISRALAGQKRYTDALRWVDKALEKYPGDKDLHIWRVRLIAWSGDLNNAWSERFRIMRAAQHRRDAAMLIADVAFWRKDCVEAVKWYDFITKKWPNAERAKSNKAWCEDKGYARQQKQGGKSVLTNRPSATDGSMPKPSPTSQKSKPESEEKNDAPTLPWVKDASKKLAEANMRLARLHAENMKLLAEKALKEKQAADREAKLAEADKGSQCSALATPQKPSECVCTKNKMPMDEEFRCCQRLKSTRLRRQCNIAVAGASR